MMVWKR